MTLVRCASPPHWQRREGLGSIVTLELSINGQDYLPPLEVHKARFEFYVVDRAPSGLSGESRASCNGNVTMM